ncbi:retrovirus-related pol polyprotein from transposon TNT 1-94 [Tanacetum coccineum]|uniref:Retrovirus-related pol polyprotein from transposon TNT 1-94 n=1 Tax=Tanacetum coccineum TaxID=301880 RepID=A0ABQ5EW09_9ASTR
MNSTVCQSNASVLNTDTVNAVNDGSNIVGVSCGKYVFMISHEKCVARYTLSRDSRVKRALFTTPIAAKSKNLEATSIVEKSRLGVAKIPTTTNKVSSALSLSADSSQRRTLSNYMKNKIATSQKWQKWFEYQPCVILLILWIVDSGCSKHMTRNLKLLRNFKEKFMGTIRFGNDHFVAITGYGDYVQGNLTICHVYYVEGLGHNLFSVRQFCDGDLEVAFRSNTCYVQNLEGGDLLTVSHESNLYTISISELATSSPLTSKDLVDGLLKSKYNKDHLCSACEQGKSIVHHTSIARTPQQNGVVERRNHTLVEAARTMLIFSKTPDFFGLKLLLLLALLRIALLKMKPKADIGIFIGYSESLRGLRIYNRKTKKIMETIHVKFDELTAIASECNNSGPGLNCLNFQDSSDEMNEIPSHQDLDNLFGPLYEEYYALSTSKVSNNSIVNTFDVEDTPSRSLIIVEDKDVAELDGNTIMHAFENPKLEEVESSLNYQDPSKMHTQLRNTSKRSKGSFNKGLWYSKDSGFELIAYSDADLAGCLDDYKISKVLDTKDTIRFKLDTQNITYTVDMIRDTLKLPVETTENPFVAPVNIKIIESFMHTVSYQDVVDKVSAFHTKFLAQLWQTMFKVFNRCLTTRTSGHNQKKINILQLFHAVVNGINVDYAALLWWDFNNCVFQKKDVFQYPRLKKLIIVDLMKKHPSISPRLEEDSIKDDISLEIRATNDYKETTPRAHRTTPSDDKERDEIAEVTFLSLALHKTALAAEAQENVAKVQEKLEEEEIKKMVEEPESHKKNLEVVNDDEVNDKGNKMKTKDDDAEKTDDAAVEKDNDDHIDHTLVGTHATGSMETRNEQMQTPIPTPTRSPRKDLSSDKTISEELTAKVSPTTATTSKDYSKLKSKRGFTSNKTKILPRSIVGMGRRRVPDHCNDVVPEMTFEKTNEMIIEEMQRPNTTLNLYPTTSSSTAETSTAALQHQLYLNMKSKPQDQPADPELWEILKGEKKGENVFWVNLTAPTLTVPGIEAHEPYSIVDKLTTGLIYLNNKDDKRVMYLVEIGKFCDAMLERVLNESVRKRNIQASMSSASNEKVGIFCEWKTNSADDEASAQPHAFGPTGPVPRLAQLVAGKYSSTTAGYYASTSVSNDDSPTTILEQGY